MTPRVVVTGGRGFVGTHVARALRAAGYAVTVTTRAGAGTNAPSPGDGADGVTVAHVADPLDSRRWREVLGGADAVVHLAARVHVMRESAADPLAEFRRVNVEGTRVVLAAAAAAGVRRVLIASSVKAVGESNEAPWTSATPPAPADPYGISKREAELVAGEVAAATGLFAPCLRFPLVYGPGVGGNMRRLFDLVAAGRPVPLGGVHNRRSLVYVGNAAAAAVALLQCPAAVGTAPALFVSDGRDVSSVELVGAIGRALGRPARVWPAPVRLLGAAARVGDALAPFWPDVPWTTAAARRLFGSLTVDATDLRRMTGYTPPVTLEAGLAETARWHMSLSAAARAAGAPGRGA